MLKIYAVIERDEEGWDYPIDVQVYIQSSGRLIEVRPYNDKTQDFESLQHAKNVLHALYPEAQIVSRTVLEAQYNADGFYCPQWYNRLTNVLCECGQPLYRQTISMKRGYNQPYGALRRTWYECYSCKREYVQHQQDVQLGILIGWYTKEQGASQHEDAEPPKANILNPYGFHEFLLIPRTTTDVPLEEE